MIPSSHSYNSTYKYEKCLILQTYSLLHVDDVYDFQYHIFNGDDFFNNSYHHTDAQVVVRKYSSIMPEKPNNFFYKKHSLLCLLQSSPHC